MAIKQVARLPSPFQVLLYLFNVNFFCLLATDLLCSFSLHTGMAIRQVIRLLLPSLTLCHRNPDHTAVLSPVQRLKNTIFSQQNRISSQSTPSQSFGLAASSPTVGNGPQGVYTKGKLEKIAKRLEANLRPWVLRYAKLTEQQMIDVVTEAIARDNVSTEDTVFKKCIVKVRTNQSTWKHQTLEAVKVSTYLEA